MKIIPKKSLGQNFLLNKDIIKKIVDLGKITSNNIVLEIGPGTGNLTSEILKRKPKKLVAIEKDVNLFKNLKNKFKSDLDIINQDVLNFNWEIFTDKKIIVFGNLPYNISAKLLIDWIRLDNLNNSFKKFILMFQKEVADRIVADLNTKKYGRLTILTNWKMTATKVMDIDPENFFPAPKVKSSLLYFEPKKTHFLLKNSKNLEKVTDIFFQNKRKMIKKPLNILFNDSEKIIKKFNLDYTKRPQNIDTLTFFKISKEYEEKLFKSAY
tara:strand:+ start:333 stop:1136 length:804 start_codon:yes stop_codon:yes gene_type:complete